ncbi:hypothetical protein KIN20_034296 [Parelaphostrongylus tenuis]|uniref:Uncharacterized protein n=1 Tax=Parelaphostrongylus tenuis TaxID=148309 RepID=A0AAD5WJY0_PARTN|nr:hypothetical protein KIN20_034296 [Parelaphostrongylus tenuis]
MTLVECLQSFAVTFSFFVVVRIKSSPAEYRLNEELYSVMPLFIALGENWYYHCASLLKHLSNDMRKAIQQFSQVRRTTYPQGSSLFDANENASHAKKMKAFLEVDTAMAYVRLGSIALLISHTPH